MRQMAAATWKLTVPEGLPQLDVLLWEAELFAVASRARGRGRHASGCQMDSAPARWQPDGLFCSIIRLIQAFQSTIKAAGRVSRAADTHLGNS